MFEFLNYLPKVGILCICFQFSILSVSGSACVIHRSPSIFKFCLRCCFCFGGSIEILCFTQGNWFSILQQFNDFEHFRSPESLSDLLLWVGVRRRTLTSSSQELLGQSWPNLVCSSCRVRRPETIYSLTHLHPKGDEILE